MPAASCRSRSAALLVLSPAAAGTRVVTADLALPRPLNVPLASPLHPVSRRPPVCQLTAFGESALDFNLHFWIEDPEEGMGNVRSDVMFALWHAFRREGISFPSQVHDVRLRMADDGAPNAALAALAPAPSQTGKPAGA